MVITSTTMLAFVSVGGILGLLHALSLLGKKEADIKKEKEDSARRLYELTILKELGERAGYSLNVKKILQIITGSLKQFLDYTAVGYVLVTPQKLHLHVRIEKSISASFLKDMEGKMVASLEALTGNNFTNFEKEEVLTGMTVKSDRPEPLGSSFNIPLVIDGQVAAVLTIAHTASGLYKEEDMTILYKITNQASAAVSKLQAVLKSEQSKLNMMVESMGDGVLLFDADLSITVANPAVKKIVNFRQDREVNIFDFVDALGGKFDIQGRLGEVLIKKKPFVSEIVNINNSYYEIGVYPVAHAPTKENHQNPGAVVVFHDVSRDIELQRVREEFTSMIVHELRSPLDGVKKIIELLSSGTIKPRSTDFKDSLKMAYQSSSEMLHLVNDILDLSKLQAGKFEIHKEDSNIKDIVENRIGFYKISSEMRDIKLESVVEKNVPSSLNFDPQAIKQILNNFISNALKFTRSEGRVLVSVFEFKRDEFPPDEVYNKLTELGLEVFPKESDLKISDKLKKNLCVVVSDSGLGIPQENLKDLFQSFKQAKYSPVDKENKGTGLGLVIAKGIVDQHKGTIGVVSKEDKGSSFFFTIPI